GARTCGSCKDGLNEPRLNEALVKFAGWGPGPITSYLRAGVSVRLLSGGREADVTCWVRTLESNPPLAEVTRWTRADARAWKRGQQPSQLKPSAGLPTPSEPAPQAPLERPGSWIFLE